LTRYFFSLTGTSGDLIVTVESRNLNGDVDLFTSGALRPLAKLTMYAGGTAGSTSRTIYFKRNEALILRVEARSPNDDEGSFRIRFEGAFAPFVGEAREPEPVGPSQPQTATTGRRTKRVTATGARIDEPVLETAETTTEPATSPARTPEAAATENTPGTSGPATARTEPAARTNNRAPRGRRPRAPRSAPRTTTARTRRPNAPAATTGEPGSESAKESARETARENGSQPPARPARPSAVRRATSTPTEPAAAGPRLIIETRDGLRVERYMTSVRRVTVDNGQVVVILKNGKVERQPMTNVLKMSIEP
jgi:hypothetical protein